MNAPLPRDVAQVRDALIDEWLENTERGRALLGSRDQAEVRAEIARLNDSGLVRIAISEPNAAGRFSLQIEAAVPVPANDSPAVPLNRHERRAAARRSRL